MKKYAYIVDGSVNQVIYAFSDDFPNIPITERFAKEILDNCVEVDENEDIREGMLYDSNTGAFSIDVNDSRNLEEENSYEE